MRTISADLCVRCKGYKYLCGLPVCPLMERFRAITRTMASVKVDGSSSAVSGATPPSAIVGERGYPKVAVLYNVPPGVGEQEARRFEDPENWWGNVGLTEILRLRSSMISSVYSQVNVSEPWKLYEREISLTSISSKPVDSEVRVKGVIEPKLKFDGLLLPRGPTAEAESIRLVGNPKLSKPLERLINDDVKVEQAIREIYGQESRYTLINALAFGLLGERKSRRIVPTRWAITAVDGALGKYFLNKVRRHPLYNELEVHFSSYLGNDFHVILVPSPYTAAWVEIWHPTTPWAQEVTVVELREDHFGHYEFLDGGYMAARLAVLEYLNSLGRQATVIIVREITKEYFAPVGNWHIRETVKRAMGNVVLKGVELEQALKFVSRRLRAAVDLTKLKTISSVRGQKRIDEFTM
ncbi:hypothetical protein HS1genome_1065 [Sulfodiicoccus acidiphilus]|uniref:DNA repair protein n=1 Tax=Sulfodiicoccus acidiphilus TaxID=1670455 RepID=A0A348B3C4_9CREN|nr:Nre family DNA repair protein [Sulfodiicoccus acidiphilus]BBD72676.1 hypothetical protein HS1genome_1065 [Sulfodiicoccus acidiphilus]GGT95563.1 hypothetical protein GCM10007116_11410 [Sulfodiicoccus acidiphilus]